MIQKKFTPGETFVEEVIRPIHLVNGEAKLDTELVSVEQVYNDYGIKIRIQCSSCQKYKTQKPHSQTFTFCPDCLVTAKTGRYPNGRGCCKEWEMSDVCKLAGSPNHVDGKVKSVDYLRWLSNNAKKLAKLKEVVAKWADWTLWVRDQYTFETGLDVYGKRNG